MATEKFSVWLLIFGGVLIVASTFLKPQQNRDRMMYLGLALFVVAYALLLEE